MLCVGDVVRLSDGHEWVVISRFVAQGGPLNAPSFSYKFLSNNYMVCEGFG